MKASKLSKQKWVLYCGVSSEIVAVNAIVFSSENFISALVLGMKEIHFLSKNVFWENAVGYLRNGEC